MFFDSLLLPKTLLKNRKRSKTPKNVKIQMNSALIASKEVVPLMSEMSTYTSSNGVKIHNL